MHCLNCSDQITGTVVTVSVTGDSRSIERLHVCICIPT